MQTDLITDGDGQRTQVGPDSLDYVLRYLAGDYDCYHQGRYIGSRATLPKAIEAVEHEQAKAARHPQSLPAADTTIAVGWDELHAIAARLQDLAGRLAIDPAEHALIRPHLTLAHIRIAAALRNVQDAEHSLALARRTSAADVPLDAAA
ncbi:MAG: hypothetical protein M3R61_14950 [Chloroflexota bacterium]|nr:hypothetical protein [Chloroflexota bacterium]